MTSAARLTARTYRIRVEGHLDDHWSAWSDDLVLTREGDGTTTLAGPVADQAELHGLLNRVRDIGATLLDLHVEPPPGAGPPAAVLARPLHTERLTLRSGTPGDADATYAYRRLESVGQWLTALPSDLSAYRTRFSAPARLAKTVIVELQGVVVGDLMLRVEDAWAQAEVADRARGRQAELGWVLDPAYTGRGLATEAVRRLLAVAFEDLGVRRVSANAFADNLASCRLMERIGMRRETYAVQESLHRSGRWLDSVSYALRADEWAADRWRPRGDAAASG